MNCCYQKKLSGRRKASYGNTFHELNGNMNKKACLYSQIEVSNEGQSVTTQNTQQLNEEGEEGDAATLLNFNNHLPKTTLHNKDFALNTTLKDEVQRNNSRKYSSRAKCSEGHLLKSQDKCSTCQKKLNICAQYAKLHNGI